MTIQERPRRAAGHQCRSAIKEHFTADHQATKNRADGQHKAHKKEKCESLGMAVHWCYIMIMFVSVFVGLEGAVTGLYFYIRPKVAGPGEVISRAKWIALKCILVTHSVDVKDMERAFTTRYPQYKPGAEGDPISGKTIIGVWISCLTVSTPKIDGLTNVENWEDLNDLIEKIRNRHWSDTKVRLSRDQVRKYLMGHLMTDKANENRSLQMVFNGEKEEEAVTGQGEEVQQQQASP